MTNKEFRRLSRADLVEIIYELQKSEQQLQQEIETLRQALQQQEFKMEKAGSLADAVVSLSNLMEDAQKAADLYLQQRKLRAEKEAEEILRQARETADQMIAQILADARDDGSKPAETNAGQTGPSADASNHELPQTEAKSADQNAELTSSENKADSQQKSKKEGNDIAHADFSSSENSSKKADHSDRRAGRRRKKKASSSKKV